MKKNAKGTYFASSETDMQETHSRAPPPKTEGKNNNNNIIEENAKRLTFLLSPTKFV